MENFVFRRRKAEPINVPRTAIYDGAMHISYSNREYYFYKYLAALPQFSSNIKQLKKSDF